MMGILFTAGMALSRNRFAMKRRIVCEFPRCTVARYADPRRVCEAARSTGRAIYSHGRPQQWTCLFVIWTPTAMQLWAKWRTRTGFQSGGSMWHALTLRVTRKRTDSTETVWLNSTLVFAGSRCWSKQILRATGRSSCTVLSKITLHVLQQERFANSYLAFFSKILMVNRTFIFRHSCPAGATSPCWQQGCEFAHLHRGASSLHLIQHESSSKPGSHSSPGSIIPLPHCSPFGSRPDQNIIVLVTQFEIGLGFITGIWQAGELLRLIKLIEYPFGLWRKLRRKRGGWCRCAH